MSDIIIAGKDCEKCKFCTLANEDSARDIGICCSAKDNKFYRWGTCINCIDKEIKI